MSKDQLQSLKEEGKLRSEKTWWSVQDWIERKESPLDIIRIIQGVF
jgi:hypothetical protein